LQALCLALANQQLEYISLWAMWAI
jgi:hypothetical protein